MALLSPSEFVRDEAKNLIKKHRHIFRLQEASPSRFEGELFLKTPDWKVKFQMTRPTNLDWVLSSQGDFLVLYQKSIDSLMNSEGPLPRPWRHYIAMIGASCHSCEYLVRNQLEQFVLSGGDPDWFVSGGDSVPKKLKCLMSVSSMMAHKPWTLNSSHLEHLTSECRWSTSELHHALMILSTFLSLPSLVFGAGVKIEEDLATETEYSSRSPLVEAEPEWDELEALPKCFSLVDSSPSLLQRLLQQTKIVASQRSISSVGEEPISAFEGFGALNENANSGVSSPVVKHVAPVVGSKPGARMGDEEKGELASIMACHPSWITPVCNVVRSGCPASSAACEYKDFSMKTDTTLHTMSFSWEDHGMMILGRQLPEATDAINAENQHCIEFSSNTIGDYAIESTTTVREAIIKYVQRMYGVFHDDYRYERLNKILPVIHKAYLKKLACYPERITTVDYMRMRKFEGFSSKDLIHYAHLVFQTRRIVSLTWAMNAFS